MARYLCKLMSVSIWIGVRKAVWVGWLIGYRLHYICTVQTSKNLTRIDTAPIHACLTPSQILVVMQALHQLMVRFWGFQLRWAIQSLSGEYATRLGLWLSPILS